KSLRRNMRNQFQANLNNNSTSNSNYEANEKRAL
ncbi:unnamed protein product, partial [Rotaria sordida]